jgi:hypothetical protein
LLPSEQGDGPRGAAPATVWDRLESQIEWYDSRARSNQLWFKVLKVAQIVIAAGIPVVAAAGGTAAVAGAMGATVVVLEGLQQLFQFQQNWTSYRATSEALKHEKFLFLAAAEPYNSADRDQRLAAQVEMLVSQETSAWAAQQRQLQRDSKSGSSSS